MACHCNRTASDRELRRRFRLCVACRRCEAWKSLSAVAASDCPRLADPLIAIRQTCHGCRRCEFARLSPPRQRERIERGHVCILHLWPPVGDAAGNSESDHDA
ncbi:MAG: hypothetical protein BWX88_04132 [Planctomycetes bacterium ADurb.Bin126]|nr:MAG: hypothetical protein BWX88_04132 [Planctomycetes bacterium ADurb.Bin126]HOD84614.1 hypothetical protein [Phycisphaerae bacterium]